MFGIMIEQSYRCNKEITSTQVGRILLESGVELVN